MKNEKLPARRRMQKHPPPKKRPVGRSDGTTTMTDKVANILGRSPKATTFARRVPAKWRWHHGALLALQSRLMGDCGELKRASTQLIEPHSMDEADSATEEFAHDLALAQLSTEQNALYEVNEALNRILDGNYGVCEETGKAISAARLKAVPWTRFTIEVEERLEKKGVVSWGRLNKAGSVHRKAPFRLTPNADAEEAGEEAPSPPNDESLPNVFSPPGRHA